MSRITFSISFAARSDNTPTADGWTYHHILPWRYYYATGVVLAQVARLLMVGKTYHPKSKYNHNVLEKVFKDLDSKNLTQEYGIDYSQFKSAAADSQVTAFGLLDLCNTLHGAGNQNQNAMNASLIRRNGFDFGEIGNLCGAPRFGGFLGMAPEHRQDDPGNNAEPNRPASLPKERWGALNLLRTHLTKFAPGMLGASAGSKITATVDWETFELFSVNLQKLIRSHDFPTPFQPSDWGLVSSKQKPWGYLRGKLPTVMIGSRVDRVFEVKTSNDASCGQFVAAADFSMDWRVYSPDGNDRKAFKWDNRKPPNPESKLPGV
jgi:hypothetical protein